MFPPGFTCPAVLWIQLADFSFYIRDFHSLWWTVPCPSVNLCQCRLLSIPRENFFSRFGLFRVRSPLLAESRLISFPRPTQMFQFRRFPTYAYFIQRTLTEYCSAGFPHSDIHGSLAAFAYPWLFADCCVLRRLLVPRHSPYALCSLTTFSIARIIWFLQVFPRR